MPESYSGDLRVRVIEAVESGASRHEAAELFEVSVSSAIRWLQTWHGERRAAPKRRGGSVSRLEKHAAKILELQAEKPDRSLMETVSELAKRRIKTSKSALSRFFLRHDLTYKKKPAGGRAGTRRRSQSAPALDPAARAARSGPPGVHRRDIDQYQHDPAARPQPAGGAADRSRAARALDDDHLRCRPAS